MNYLLRLLLSGGDVSCLQIYNCLMRSVPKSRLRSQLSKTGCSNISLCGGVNFQHAVIVYASVTVLAQGKHALSVCHSIYLNANGLISQ